MPSVRTVTEAGGDAGGGEAASRVVPAVAVHPGNPTPATDVRKDGDRERDDSRAGPIGALRVQVCDGETGAPLPGVRVFTFSDPLQAFRREDAAAATTDDNGTAWLDHGAHLVLAAEGYASRHVDVTSITQGDAVVRAVLQREGKLRLEVSDSRGRPIPDLGIEVGTTLRITAPPEPGSPAQQVADVGRRRRVRTGGDGAVLVDDLPAGLWRLEIADGAWAFEAPSMARPLARVGGGEPVAHHVVLHPVVAGALVLRGACFDDVVGWQSFRARELVPLDAGPRSDAVPGRRGLVEETVSRLRDDAIRSGRWSAPDPMIVMVFADRDLLREGPRPLDIMVMGGQRPRDSCPLWLHPAGAGECAVAVHDLAGTDPPPGHHVALRFFLNDGEPAPFLPAFHNRRFHRHSVMPGQMLLHRLAANAVVVRAIRPDDLRVVAGRELGRLAPPWRNPEGILTIDLAFPEGLRAVALDAFDPYGRRAAHLQVRDGSDELEVHGPRPVLFLRTPAVRIAPGDGLSATSWIAIPSRPPEVWPEPLPLHLAETSGY